MELSEKLFLWRKRLNKNQAVMAEDLGLSVREYLAAEHGLNALLCGDVSGAGDVEATLSDRERCVLARRRAGLTQREVAEALGVHRVSVVQMEKGVVSCERLLIYWQQRGAL